MITDPIADFITRLRNASLAKQRSVIVPYSKLKHAMLAILKAEGFVADVELDPDQRSMNIQLRYTPDGKPVLREVARVSTPGRRMYVRRRRIPRVMGGMGVAIVSTSQGLMTDREARRRRLGGELLCTVS